jgi:coenzyme F420-dependent glucose-6-phosphate dehydrogenase
MWFTATLGAVLFYGFFRRFISSTCYAEQEYRMKIGYHAAHEQFSPGELLRLTCRAEEAGFGSVQSSDHIRPWSERQGHSGYAWSWLGAALQATSLPFGVVTVPGYRQHPATVAQASATLAEMFPNRFWLALGSGERFNEIITGVEWPPKAERNARLREAAEIIRLLWQGETVSREGFFTLEEAKLYSRPARPPLLIGAALTPETAEWLGGWADGLITVSKPREKLRQVTEAFRRGGGKDKPMFLKAQISYAENEKMAVKGAWEQWRTNVLDSSVLAELRSTEQFEAASLFVKPEDMHEHIRISINLKRHIEWLSEDLEMGFSQVIIHNVNREQERFIKDFGTSVLPAFEGENSG